LLFLFASLQLLKERFYAQQHFGIKATFILLLFFTPNLSQAQLSFQHWQTFRQTEAFRPNLELDKGLSYQYQPSGSSNRFNTKPTTEFSYFLQQQQTPGYLEFNELGFFCTLDLKLDLTMKIPFRFRLGNLDTVNRKEGYYD
jgi:hypothetical protein